MAARARLFHSDGRPLPLARSASVRRVHPGALSVRVLRRSVGPDGRQPARRMAPGRERIPKAAGRLGSAGRAAAVGPDPGLSPGGRPGGPALNFAIDPHWTPEGHRLAADVIGQWLEDAGAIA